MNKIKPINILLVFLTMAGVLQIRIETVVISYDLAQKSKNLKEQESFTRILNAVYEQQVGSERMVLEASGMVALKIPKVEQVVMIDKSGLAITR